MLRFLMLDIPTARALPQNEPVLTYAKGSPERADLETALKAMRAECPEVPHVVHGQPVREGTLFDVREPHAHARVRARVFGATKGVAHRAIEAAIQAQPAWAAMPFDERARIFLRAADLLAGPWRKVLNAATMLGQSKTAFQAEIDAACELIDFLRFNVAFASRLAEQPISPAGMNNALEMRPLEGFIFAVTPFNFTAIAGNLPTAPAMLGNVVVWKPAEDQSLAAYHLVRLFEAAGLPPGVINVVYGDGALVAEECLAHPALAGVHFTGSTKVFQSIWRTIGERIATYRSYPRIVGETGGKDFVYAHPSADEDALVTALIRGAFEFQGQKCSAASRAYLPRSLWGRVKERLVAEAKSLTMGDVTDFSHFMGAVINERAYTRLGSWLDRANHDRACTVLHEGTWSKAEGWFCGPTLIEVMDPSHPILAEELFGPMLSIHVYDDAKPDAERSVLRIIDQTSPYALTGAIFSRERAPIALAAKELRQAAGNLYINDKPTGAVVGQQPFGGARGSGTNDKAGAAYNLLRWASPRVVKETWAAPTKVPYPYQA
jgi:1-pyrroline-5-carboxylate dehydrogenase